MATMIKDFWLHDPPYHPSDSECFYLDDAFLKQLLATLTDDDEIKQEMIDVICTHETLHRQMVLGDISKVEATHLVDTLFENYRRTHKRWPHQEKGYDEFYRLLNNGNWR